MIIITRPLCVWVWLNRKWVYCAQAFTHKLNEFLCYTPRLIQYICIKIKHILYVSITKILFQERKFIQNTNQLKHSLCNLKKHTRHWLHISTKFICLLKSFTVFSQWYIHMQYITLSVLQCINVQQLLHSHRIWCWVGLGCRVHRWRKNDELLSNRIKPHG